MGRMTGRSRFPVDASLILNAGTVALSAITTFTAWPLAQVGAVWQNPPDPRDGTVYVVGNVEAVTGSPTTLQLEIWAYDNVALANPVKVSDHPLSVNEWFEIPTDQFAILREYPTKTYWAAKLNIAGGTSPTATIFAYLAPDYD